MIFCSPDPDNIYRILFTISGNYQITKKVAGTYLEFPIQDWTHTSWWTDGYDINNTIKIIKTGEDTFDIYCNNNIIYTLNDSSFDSGVAGFYAWISSNEDFPNIDLDVRFKMIQPINIP